MKRSIFRQVVLVVATGAVVLAGSSAAQAGGDHHGGRQTVDVVGNGSMVHVDRATVRSGTVRFKVSTTGAEGSGTTLFRLNRGVSLDKFFADLAEEFSQTPATAAKGTRDLTRDVWALGLADVVKGYPEVVTEKVERGTYYLMDLGSGPPPNGRPALTTLTVRGHDGRADVRSQVRVSTVDERFIAPRVWPHKGTYSFTNRADVIHFMVIQPVKTGTTDAQIQAFFDHAAANSNAQPPFARTGPSGGNDVVSPGGRIKVTYNLPAGTYVLLCFIADEDTGMPHAVMGMHRVIRLK